MSPQLLERLDDVPEAPAPAMPAARADNGKRARTLSHPGRAQSPALERWGSPALLSDSHVSLLPLLAADSADVPADFFIN